MKYNGELQRIRILHTEDDPQDKEAGVPELTMITVAPIFTVLGCGIVISLLFLLGERIKRRLVNQNTTGYNYFPSTKYRVMGSLKKFKTRRMSM